MQMSNILIHSIVQRKGIGKNDLIGLPRSFRTRIWVISSRIIKKKSSSYTLLAHLSIATFDLGLLLLHTLL